MRSIAEWLSANWAIGITAIATGATALLIWLDRRDRMMKEMPFVECAITPELSPVGWMRLRLIIRNFNPHSVHMVQFRIERPRSSALFTNWEAHEQRPNDQTGMANFVATDTMPKLSAVIDDELKPAGELQREFFYSPGPGLFGRGSTSKWCLYGRYEAASFRSGKPRLLEPLCSDSRTSVHVARLQSSQFSAAKAP